MNRHMKLADWISGGLLRKSIGLAKEATAEMLKKHNIAADRYAALQSIIDCETPNANATVRRMAKIAREAVE